MFSLLGKISNIKLFGFLPLDVLLHIVASYIIIILLLKSKMNQSRAYMIVLGLALVKEIFDSFTLGSSVDESIKDVLVSMLMPTLVVLIRFVKRGNSDKVI